MQLLTPSPKPQTPARLRRDIDTLAHFIEVYCRDHHPGQPVAQIDPHVCEKQGLPTPDAELCPECRRLLTHAVVKRSHCPMDPKPQCKHCPNHCYHPTYRQQVREVMKYSGRKLAMRGRLDYVLHLLF